MRYERKAIAIFGTPAYSHIPSAIQDITGTGQDTFMKFKITREKKEKEREKEVTQRSPKAFG